MILVLLVITIFLNPFSSRIRCGGISLIEFSDMFKHIKLMFSLNQPENRSILLLVNDNETSFFRLSNRLFTFRFDIFESRMWRPESSLSTVTTNTLA